jgi:hypothetical protein
LSSILLITYSLKIYEKELHKYHSRTFFFAILVLLLLCACNAKTEKEEKDEDPDVDYFAVRNERYGTVPQEVKNAIALRLAQDAMQEENNKTAAIPKWQLIGPANAGGRITILKCPAATKTLFMRALPAAAFLKARIMG